MNHQLEPPGSPASFVEAPTYAEDVRFREAPTYAEAPTYVEDVRFREDTASGLVATLRRLAEEVAAEAFANLDPPRPAPGYAWSLPVNLLIRAYCAAHLRLARDLRNLADELGQTADGVDGSARWFREVDIDVADAIARVAPAGGAR